jgi:hypothetical protein
MPCEWSQVSKKMSMKVPCNFQVRTVGSCATVWTGLRRLPNALQCLEASTLKNVRTSGQYRPDARSSGSAPSGYVDFKFISLPLAIVRIDCTIVRVVEPQRLLVVLRNGISKEHI